MTLAAPVPAPAPVPAGRQDLPDLLRGFALFGILMVNLPFFAQPLYTAAEPALQATAADRWAAAAVAFAFEAKFYVLFSFLFGYGLAGQMRRAQDGAAALGPRYARRLIGLAVFGALHATLFFLGDILVSYALLGVVLWWIRDWPPRRLLGVAALCMVAALLARLGLASMLAAGATPDAQAEMAAWAAEARAGYGGGFGDAVRQRLKDLVVFYVFTPLFNWPTALAMFALGLAAGRAQWLSDPQSLWRRMRPVLPWVAPVAVGGSLWSAWLGLHPGAPGGAVLASAMLDAWSAPALTFCYVAVLVRGWLSPGAARWLAPLRWPGRMSLTNYLGQAVVCGFIFNGWGLGFYDRVGSLAGAGLVVAIFAAQIVLSRWWLAHFHTGPDEWLLRAWTYRRWPAFRRGAVERA
jgi:uncharacterized protein